VTFDSVSVGDQLPILVKLGTEDAICGVGTLLKPRTETETSAPTDNVQPPAPDLSAYLLELLGKGFPIENIQAEGSSLKIEPLQPINSGDTISLTGRVVDKREQGELKVVTCQMVVENQDGQILAEASAEVCL
jgi:hypothetical protein